MIIYWALDFLRKVTLCLAMTLARFHLWLQMFIFFMTAIMLIIAASYTEARKTAYDKKMDVFNEVKLIFLVYHMILFTAFVPDHETKFNVGYSCAVFLLAGVAANMLMLV